MMKLFFNLFFLIQITIFSAHADDFGTTLCSAFEIEGLEGVKISEFEGRPAVGNSLLTSASIPSELSQIELKIVKVIPVYLQSSKETYEVSFRSKFLNKNKVVSTICTFYRFPYED